MSVRLAERRFEAQASALGMTPDRLTVITEVAFMGWVVHRPWCWFRPNTQRWLFGQIGGPHVRREIERDLRGEDG